MTERQIFSIEKKGIINNMKERQTDRHLVLNKKGIRNNMIERQTDI